MSAIRLKGWHKKWTADSVDARRLIHESGLIARIVDGYARPENADAWIASADNVPSTIVLDRLRSLLIEAVDYYVYQKGKIDYELRKAQRLAHKSKIDATKGK